MAIPLVNGEVYRNKQGEKRKIIKISYDEIRYINEKGVERSCSLNTFTKWAWIME